MIPSSLLKDPKKKEIAELCSFAALLQRCEKYDKMIELAKKFICESPQLDPNQMAVFIEGYKAALNKVRKPLISLITLQQKEKVRKSSRYQEIESLINPQKVKLCELCDDFLTEVDKLIPKARDLNEMLVLNRYKCDFIRYKAQFMLIKSDEDTKKKKELAEHFMEVIRVSELCSKSLMTPTSIPYLELELSKCVFYYEVLDKTEEAIRLGKEVIKNAMDYLIGLKQKEDNTESEQKKKLQIINEAREELEETQKENIQNTVQSKKSDKLEKTEKSDNKIQETKGTKKKSNEQTSNKSKEIKEDSRNVNEGNVKTEDGSELVKFSEGSVRTEISSKKTKFADKLPTVEETQMDTKLKRTIELFKINIVLWSGKSEKDVKFT